ncbi:MAG TPA: Cd(II)/Pb(II)-responsive transcriptional regulator [Burkholderiaceae bacterium]|nr:Cd(II)/Pb(II)-responsive transcriptional regulator [Burkholderiaceae bacterium]
MRIGELARRAHCGTETIRFYEKQGLLPEPGRTESNYRKYHDWHLQRLRFIRNCRNLDMTHDEIRSLLQFMDQPHDSCEPVNQLLDDHIQHVDIRLNELEQLRRQLKALRRRCATTQPVPDCGIITGLTNMPTTEKQPSATHLG